MDEIDRLLAGVTKSCSTAEGASGRGDRAALQAYRELVFAQITRRQLRVKARPLRFVETRAPWLGRFRRGERESD